MEDLKIIFAQNLANLRKQVKLTQVEFAEKISFNKSPEFMKAIEEIENSR